MSSAISGVPLSTLIYTPWYRIPETVSASDTFAVEAGLAFSFDGETWYTTTQARGTNRRVRYRFTSSASYSTLVDYDSVVDGVTYTFSATTISDPTQYWVDENGDYLTDENGDRITI